MFFFFYFKERCWFRSMTILISSLINVVSDVTVIVSTLSAVKNTQVTVHNNSCCVFQLQIKLWPWTHKTAVKCIIIWYNEAKTPKSKILFSLCACSFTTHHSALYTQKAQSNKRLLESKHWRSSIDEIAKGTEEGYIWMLANKKQFLLIDQGRNRRWLSGLGEQDSPVTNMAVLRELDTIITR